MTEPPYVKIYFDAIPEKFIISGVLLSCLKRSTELIIIFNPKIRNEIAVENQISPDRVNHIIVDLCKTNILARAAYNIYVLNPYIFGSGSWSKTEKLRSKYGTLFTKSSPVNNKGALDTGSSIQNELLLDKLKELGILK